VFSDYNLGNQIGGNMSYIKKSLLSSAMLCGLVLGTAQANAAGFYIQEQSVKGLGTAFAGSTTSLDDASTLYFNPAGMTELESMSINAGVNLLIPEANLTNTGSTLPFGGGAAGGGDGGNPYSPTPVPNLFFVTPIGQNIWAGIGVTAPFGLGSDYGNTWFGRFDSTKTELKTINIQPSMAYKANDWLSIGGGIDIQYSDAELQSIANPNPAIGEGVSTLKGDDWTVGYNLGITIKPIEPTTIGLHYRSAISHDLEGKISFAANGANKAGDFEEGGSANLDLPDILSLGIAHDVTPKTTLMGQVTKFGWNNFQNIQPVRDSGTAVAAIEQDYSNTWAFSIGAEHDYNDQWTFRAGYQYDQTPTTDQFRTSRTPDGDRNWFSGGATYKLNDKIDLDFAATYIHVDSGNINVVRNAATPAIARANVNANTEGQVGIVALGLNYKF